MNLGIVEFIISRISFSKLAHQAWQASPLLEASNHEVDHFILVRLLTGVVADGGKRLVDDRHEHGQQDDEHYEHVQ